MYVCTYVHHYIVEEFDAAFGTTVIYNLLDGVSGRNYCKPEKKSSESPLERQDPLVLPADKKHI
jgi:hypothetical protein